jgi:hypothetical protein
MTYDEILASVARDINDQIDRELLAIISRDTLAYQAELRFYELMDKKDRTERSRREYLLMKLVPVVIPVSGLSEYY